MKQKGVMILMFDAPDSEEFLEWVHGPHMQDIGRIPGVVRVRRYSIVDGPPDRRGYVAVIETEDLDASIAYRNSEQGRRPQQDSIDRGVTNRYGLACREIFSIKFS
ncbi:MAG: hypothetical protein WDO72_04815 [Pseudomonadota bacterium]